MGQMMYDLNAETRFEILSSFAAYMTHFLLKFSNFDFLIPHCNFKISNGPCGHFFEFDIFDVRLGISVPRDIKMGGVAITLPKKMAITTRPIVACSADPPMMAQSSSLLAMTCPVTPPPGDGAGDIGAGDWPVSCDPPVTARGAGLCPVTPCDGAGDWPVSCDPPLTARGTGLCSVTPCDGAGNWPVSCDPLLRRGGLASVL